MRLYAAMASKQIRCARLLLAGGIPALLAACAAVHGASRPAVVAAPPPPPPNPPAAATPSPAPAPAARAASDSIPVIRRSAPMTYTVKRGDTLWGIASKFLRDPWDWPEVWYLNPKIHNPHWIYPGDVLALTYGRNGEPSIRIVRQSPLREQAGQEPTVRLRPQLRSTPIAAAIPTIPYSAIAPFLARPVVLSAGQVRRAPHVVAFRNEHQIAGTGSVAYVSNLGPHPHSRYSVIHVGDKLREPGDFGFGHVYGYLGTYTATAVITADGDPATATLTDSARETFRGDRLIATDAQPPLTMEPRAPSRPVRGEIIWVVGATGGADLAGQYDIVVLDRGSRAGLAPGDVLAVDHKGSVVHDTHGRFGWLFRSFGSAGHAFAPRVKLPDYRDGTLLVFKTYRDLSFALVVAASNVISVGDIVHNP